MLFCFINSNAQETEPIQKNQFNFYRNMRNDFKEYNFTKHDYTIGYERKINSEVSIGLNLNYFESDPYYFDETYNGAFTNRVNTKNSSFGASISFNYDWSKILGLNTDKFDIYTGTNIGLSYLNYSGIFESTSNENVSIRLYENSVTKHFIGGKIGARYWITKNIGVSAELDRGFYVNFNQNDTKLNLGVNFKF